MLNISKRLLICCALACCTISARADQLAESSPTAPCCGREAAVSRPLVGREPSLQAGSVNNDLSNCVCLKYIYAYWGEMCDFYATDCYGSPFPWRDFCNTPHPGECGTDSCGTCFAYAGGGSQTGRHDRQVSVLPDHTVRPRLVEESGATFFEDPFFVRISIPGRESPLSAKVFPILVPRKEAPEGLLPAQVFYSGVEIEGIPEHAKARPVRGEPLGAYGCRVIDHERVLLIRMHTKIGN